MWLFRKRPDDLTPEQQAELEKLFAAIPDLKLAYDFRWAVTDIFDTAENREDAAQQFEALRELMDPEDEDNRQLLTFFDTYDAHQQGLLAYFDGRKTSGPVEGLNKNSPRDHQTLLRRERHQNTLDPPVPGRQPGHPGPGPERFTSPPPRQHNPRGFPRLLHLETEEPT